MDFIEPVHLIKLDFVKEEFDFGEYKEDIQVLAHILFQLLEFYIEKEPSSETVEYIRTAAYIHSKHGEDADVIEEYKKEIWNAFKKGDVQTLRKLYAVMYTPQDCTGVKFELRLKEEANCQPDKNLDIYYKNGERECREAKWIAEHIEQCIDASVTYLGKLVDRYNFY